MKYLLYCVFSEQGELRGRLPPSAEGSAILIVGADGLSAAVSESRGSDASAQLSEAIAYHRVIESFHRRFTVIPFRFGTILSDEAEIETVLRKKKARYTELLQELDGCDEMGIRVLMNDSGENAGNLSPTQNPAIKLDACSGKAWLKARASDYAAASLREQAINEKTARLCRAFEGLYRKFKCDVCPLDPGCRRVESGLLSLYFLVPGDLVGRFREAFASMSRREHDKIMLTGPWPPYNFVLPEDSPG